MPAPVSAKRRPKTPREVELTDRLRSAIANGNFQPNERLVEESVADFLGTNRATVRLAFARLEQDGLIVRERNRGARVRLVSERDAVEIAEARAALEPVIARHAARNATREEIAGLRSLLKDLRAAWKAGDVAGYGSLNAELHHAIVQIARQDTVARLLAQLRSQSITFQYRAVMLPGRMSRSFGEHVELVRAIAAHDETAAEQAMREHLAAASDALHDSIVATRSARQS
jgi:DNA-binding GntR family transcriptional regulator